MKRPSFGAVFVGLMLLSSAAWGYADEVPRNTKPFTRFKILLSSPFFNDTLPFDVPFILWGDAPEGTEAGALAPTGVRLLIGQLRRPNTDCAALGPSDYAPPLHSVARTWTATDYADRGTPAPSDVGTTTRRQFEFMLPKLSPQRVYCFLFQIEPGRRLTNQETLTLTPKLLPGYRAFLVKTGTVLAADTLRIEQLRQELIQSLFAGASFDKYRAKPGTVFDPNAPAASVFEDFRSAVARVLEPHNRALQFLQRANQLRADDLPTFEKWSTSQALSTLANSLPAGNQTKADIAAIQQLSSAQRVRVLLGADPATPAVAPVEDVWQRVPGFPDQATDVLPSTPCPSSGPLMVRCNRLVETRTILDRIRDTVDAAEKGGLALTIQDGAVARPLSQMIQGTIETVEETRLTLQRLQASANERDVRMQEHLATLEASVFTDVLVLTTTLGSLETRRTWYAGMDTGFAIAPSINEVFPYLGTDLYFRPINKEAPPGPFLSRFAVLIAVTWTSNLVKAGERAALFGNDSMMLLGAGLRATEFIRLGAGALVLKSIDPNPFVTDRKIRLTPYISLSVDIDVANVFGRLFGAAATPPPVIGAGTTK